MKKLGNSGIINDKKSKETPANGTLNGDRKMMTGKREKSRKRNRKINRRGYDKR